MTTKTNLFSLLSGARGRNRTTDTKIFNPNFVIYLQHFTNILPKE
jgi:hypothetical protein